MGTLYYGDRHSRFPLLDILRRYLADESVDPVYLDPPFNSAQNYNAFFQEKDGTAEQAEGKSGGRPGGRVAAAQIAAFEDTWEWNVDAEKTYGELIVQPGRVSEVRQAFLTFLGRNDRGGGRESRGLVGGRARAYLAMMAPRLVELHRVLKKTGSLYLHCAPTGQGMLDEVCDFAVCL